MRSTQTVRTAALVAFLLGLAAATAAPVAPALAYAGPTPADDPPDFVVVFDAGTACSGFDLRVEGWNGNQVISEFKDKAGVVRTLSAGTGSALRFTNLASGQTLVTKSDGAVNHTRTYSLDGSSTMALTGHNVVILYPSDIPAGPSTTLYLGRVVIAIDSAGTFDRQSVSGRQVDVCAAVS
jgi:hypothetical protein